MEWAYQDAHPDMRRAAQRLNPRRQASATEAIEKLGYSGSPDYPEAAIELQPAAVLSMIGAGTPFTRARDMTALDAKREEIAALIALDLGFGDLGRLHPEERAQVDVETVNAIAAHGAGIVDDADPHLANVKLRKLLSAYADLAALPADERDVRLAAKGEVFSRENDA